MNNTFMRKRKFLFIVPFAIAAIFLLPWAVMYLWNTVLVAVLHVSIITYWQALGIFILSKLLFGGNMMGGRHKRGGEMNGHMRDKFMNMTQDEKDAFKQRWKEKFNW